MVLQRLRLLPWRRVDVSFAGAAFGSAHNNIQVGARLSGGEQRQPSRSHTDFCTGRKPAGPWVLGACIEDWGGGKRTELSSQDKAQSRACCDDAPRPWPLPAARRPPGGPTAWACRSWRTCASTSRCGA